SPAIFFYYSTLFDSRFKTLQQNPLGKSPILHFVHFSKFTVLFLRGVWGIPQENILSACGELTSKLSSTC
ncbi:hypothetical protein, partial [Streptococcus alactolyticus]|uniref:hypothetical protein n=1 Tax=Streptococcus alactolyticus TaxID=29389 RepID=UPI003D06FE00